MKTEIVITACLLAGSLLGCKSFKDKEDSVVAAQERNESAAIDESVSDFLTEAADARMMDLAQGKLAQERGTTDDVKKYGAWMVEEQTELLREIKSLAKSKNISLPQKLSYEKEEGLATLEGKNGRDFDEKFIKMMTIDHKRDVKKFKNALTVKDKEVQEFASKYLPAIESHLERVIEIKKDAISWSTVN